MNAGVADVVVAVPNWEAATVVTAAVVCPPKENPSVEGGAELPAIPNENPADAGTVVVGFELNENPAAEVVDVGAEQVLKVKPTPAGVWVVPELVTEAKLNPAVVAAAVVVTVGAEEIVDCGLAKVKPPVVEEADVLAVPMPKVNPDTALGLVELEVAVVVVAAAKAMPIPVSCSF